jgi:hypothetical protein
MSTNHSNQRDLPSGDSPDDDAIIPGASEPDPAEVVGSDDSPRDLAGHEFNDPNVRETLDERLAVQLILGEDGVDMDADGAEGDDDGDGDSELGAEEAAVHVEDVIR